MLKFTRNGAGSYGATLTDGRTVELVNMHAIGEGGSDDWQILIGDAWCHTLDLLRDAKEYVRFVERYGDTEGNRKFWEWF